MKLAGALLGAAPISKRCAVLLVLLATAPLACGAPRPPDLLLITLDTTRADALGVYHPGRRTPHLDALAAESLVFGEAITTTPYTGPAHASMLTGLSPPRHGLRDYLKQRLPGTARTIAEILGEAGYETVAFVSAYVLDPRYGLDQGFEIYSSRLWKPGAPDARGPLHEKGKARIFFQRRAENTVSEAIAWLRARSTERPFFAWIHLYDPHAPYDPPPGLSPARSRRGE